MSMRRWVTLFLFVACTAGFAEKKRDPLTDKEVDQIRETTQDPDKRIPLYIQFAKTRLLAIDQLRADMKLKADRGKQIHDLLEDFTTIADELDDNIDMYQRQHLDLRKVLKQVVEAYTDWQLKLRSIKEAQGISEAEAKAYSFPLDSAIDAVNSGLDSSRDLLDKQNRDLKDLKKKK